jgi:hypothetical protein
VPAPAEIAAPEVVLGATSHDGIAASIFALVERGVDRRPMLAEGLEGEIELRFAEDIAPVTITLGVNAIVVGDGPAEHPTLVVSGRLPHIVALTTAPLLGGVPSPIARRGRAALARVANGRVKVSGDRALGRKLLRLMEL